jgi:hypothetical protein
MNTMYRDCGIRLALLVRRRSCIMNNLFSSVDLPVADTHPGWKNPELGFYAARI